MGFPAPANLDLLGEKEITKEVTLKKRVLCLHLLEYNLRLKLSGVNATRIFCDEIARSLNPNTQKIWSGPCPAISLSSLAAWCHTRPDEGRALFNEKAWKTEPYTRWAETTNKKENFPKAKALG